MESVPKMSSPKPCTVCGDARMGDYTDYCVDCYWDADKARKHGEKPIFTSKPAPTQPRPNVSILKLKVESANS